MASFTPWRVAEPRANRSRHGGSRRLGGQLVQIDRANLQRGSLARPDAKLEIRRLFTSQNGEDQLKPLPSDRRIKTKLAHPDDLPRAVTDDIEPEVGQ